jgi:diguanylate cyclase (GGDEF)-like protein
MDLIRETWKGMALTWQDSGLNEESSVFSITSDNDRSDWIELSVQQMHSRESGEPFFFIFVLHPDQFTSLQDRLVSQALFDPLTGLPNRGLGQDRLQKSLDRLSRDIGNGFTLIFLDLNGFKQVNERLGHRAGDELLKTVSDRLIARTRATDTVCRWGGDEFLILFESTYETAFARSMAERILESFQEPFVWGDTEVQLGASLGVVINTDCQAEIADLIDRADQAMYKAKSDGPNGYRLLTPWDERKIGRDSFSKEIARGLERGQFHLEYQPILNLDTQDLVGVEALVRWNSPGRGLLYPGDFMPGLEDTSLLSRLDEWIVDRACADMDSWRERSPAAQSLNMHINVSEAQFRNRSLVGIMKSRACQHRLPPERIYLDCRKQPFLGDGQAAMQTCELCNSLGINLVLDDLQVNLFNLNFFYEFSVIPFRMVKINGQILDSIANGKQTMLRSLQTFLNIFSGLGVKLAIKGIESVQQYRAVRDMNCHLGQGCYLAPPMTREALQRYLEDRVTLPPSAA